MKIRNAVSEREALRIGLGEHADHRVDLGQVAVDGLDLPRQILPPAGQLQEGLGHLHVQQAAELTVAWNAALAIAQDLHRGEIGRLAGVLAPQVLQVARIVVQGERAGIFRPRRVDHVDEGDVGVQQVRVAGGDLRQARRSKETIVAVSAEGEIVAH